jgi:hypothetical protein
MFKTLSPARRRTLVWFLLAVAALILLAGGVNGISFQPGKIFGQNIILPPTATAGQVGTSGNNEIFQIIMRGILALLLIMLAISVIMALMTKEGRRRLFANLVLMVIVLLIADRIQKSPMREAEQAAPPVEIGAPKIGTDKGEPLPPPPPIPNEGIVFITSIVVVVAGVSLALWLSRGWLFPRKLQTIDQLGREAERARSDLASGGDLEDVVIRCYRQMSRIAQEARKLQRSQSMTPREFEESLTHSGLPAIPVQNLTRIFEDVRYGGLTPGSAERQVAIDSLTAIAAACRQDQN